jgi:hypothetical protein
LRQAIGDVTDCKRQQRGNTKYDRPVRARLVHPRLWRGASSHRGTCSLNNYHKNFSPPGGSSTAAQCKP